MTPDQAVNPFGSLLPFLMILAIFYFVVMRPEKLKQKQHREKVAALQKNDQVITSGGIHGTVVNVKPTTVVIRVDDNAKLEVDKEAVTVIKDK